MAYNVSYFLETFPESFDVWNATGKLNYFVTYLEGFANLPEKIKQWLTEEITHDDVESFSSEQDVPRNDTVSVLGYMYE